VSRFGRPSLVATFLIAAAGAFAACGGTAPATTQGPVPSGTIAVDAKEYQFTPSSITAPAGKVTFSVHNAGSVEHEFEIFRGDQVVDEVEGLVPGLTKSVTVDLAAGQYIYVCKLSGHDQLGMKGTLTVN
jgi:iron uptake system component EfeO